MIDKIPVNTYLEPDDVDKLDELMSYFHVDKRATAIRVLIRKGFDEYTREIRAKHEQVGKVTKK